MHSAAGIGPRRLTPERPPRPSAPHVDVADAVVVVLEELRSPAAPILVAHGPPAEGGIASGAGRCAASACVAVWQCAARAGADSQLAAPA